MTGRTRAALGSVALVLAGCAKILGVKEGSPAAPATEAGTPASGGPHFDFADAICGACVTTNCATVLAACDRNVPCAAWEGCMARCRPGDGACEHACFVGTGLTNAGMGDVSMCTSEHCYDECQATGYASAWAPTCGSTTRAKLDAQSRACVGDGDCRELWKCLFAENCLLPLGGADSGASEAGKGQRTPSCSWDCWDRFHIYEPARAAADAGLTMRPAMAIAVSTFFGLYADCALGDLSCVGHYQWTPPPAKVAQVDVTVFVNQGAYPELPGVPLSSVPVRACRQQDGTCTTRFDAQIAGADGIAHLSLPTEASGLAWYFELDLGATKKWPLGVSKVLINSGRRLNQDTFIPLTLQPELLKAKDPSIGFSGSTWDPSKAGLAIWTRSCDNSLALGLELRVEGGDAEATSITYYNASQGRFAEPSAATWGAGTSGLEPGLRRVSAWKGSLKVAEEAVVLKADAITFVNWLEPLRAVGPGQ